MRVEVKQVIFYKQNLQLKFGGILDLKQQLLSNSQICLKLVKKFL